MLAWQQAQALVLRETVVLSIEKTPVNASVGLCLAEEILSPLSLPPFDRSLMDGYALKYSDLQRGDHLKCIGRILAGEDAIGSLKNGECIKIMTGAPMIKGADTVIPVEKVHRHGEMIEVFQGSHCKGQYIGRKGESIKKGQKLFSKGTILKTNHLALISSMGRKNVKVVRKPQVAILNTGEELLAAGAKRYGSKIFDSNGPQLEGLLKAEGITGFSLGKVKDDRACLASAIRKGLKSDVFILTGGVSMGDYDFIPSVLKKCGVRKIFHKVKVKPGKPLFFGKKKNTLVFALPGNPVSTFVNYHLFIKKALQKMTGQRPEARFSKGILRKAYMNQEKEREVFAPVKITQKQDQIYLSPVVFKNSGDVHSLSLADGFMRVSPSRRKIEKGSIVSYFKI